MIESCYRLLELTSNGKKVGEHKIKAVVGAVRSLVNVLLLEG